VTLHLILLLLAAAVLAVVACRSLGLPPILGYLLVGALAGPHALGILPDTDSAHRLAEFGVVFLMFTIGLEFSLPRLFAMKRIVFGLGLAQVLVTMLAVGAGAMAWGCRGKQVWRWAGRLPCRRPRSCRNCWLTGANSTPRMVAR
jgi:CPA2 family monovalent cation:H+ antiporter-2